MPGVILPVSDTITRMQEAHWVWSGEPTGGPLVGRGGIHHHHLWCWAGFIAGADGLDHFQMPAQLRWLKRWLERRLGG
ncbi:MAG: hypothetical protein EXS36_17885 [Pedosphaera sp.]|nr:hypothetical protein [Pedosphaera sp.]